MERRKHIRFVTEILELSRNLARDCRGVTAVEYGIILSVTGAAVILGLGAAGTSIAGIFATISASLQAAIAA